MKAEWTNSDSLTISQTTKAILVLDEMPNDCNECPLNSDGYCDVLQEYALLNEWVEDAPYYSLKEKGVCPLKPMPEKLHEVSYDSWWGWNKIFDHVIEEQIKVVDFAKGWNTCLNEITGETE